MLATPTPLPQYFDLEGDPLDGGTIYFGQAGQNPETAPIAVYWDAAGTQPAAQPVKTLRGYAARNGSPALLFTSGDYSLLLRDRRGRRVMNVPSVAAISNDISLQAQLSALADASDPAMGPSLVPFVPSLTYSAGVGRKLNEIVSLRDEAAGDGTANDATACQAVITRSAGKVIDGLGRTYKVNAGLTLPARTRLRNAVFDFSGAPASAVLFSAAGTAGAAVALSADAAAEALTVSVANASSFSAGGYAWVSSTHIYETITNSTQGELVRIKSVDTGTNTLTLYSALYFGYATADTAAVAPYTMAEDIVLENVRATGGGAGQAHVMARFQRCRNVRVINCTGDQFDDRNIEFDRCWDFKVNLGEYQRSTRAGFAYGIAAINGCRDGLILGVTGRYMRHLVTQGGTGGINLNCRAHFCEAHDMMDAGFDAHPSSDHVDYSYNYVQHGGTTSGNNDGIICQGKNFRAVGNTVLGTGRYGIFHQLCHSGGKAGTTTIDDNYIQQAASKGTYGVFILTESGSGAAATGVSASFNKISNCSAAHVIVYAIGGNINDVSVVGNTALDDATSYSIQLRADAVAIRDFTVTGNTGRSAGSQVIYMVGTGAGIIERGHVEGNVTVGGSTAAVRGIQTDYITYGPNTCSGHTALYSIAGSGNVSHHALAGSKTYDPPSLADGAGTTTTVTVTGAALGDIVDGVSFSLDLQGITVTAWVSAADTVSVRFQNETGGTLDLASGTLRARVIKL